MQKSELTSAAKVRYSAMELSVAALLSHFVGIRVVRWVPCHYDVERPQVADGRNGFQL
jgi:hypothetical protein